MLIPGNELMIKMESRMIKDEVDLGKMSSHVSIPWVWFSKPIINKFDAYSYSLIISVLFSDMYLLITKTVLTQ